jgi:excisionase family DNA binding protein
MPRNETEPLMTVDDVAEFLAVSPKTIRNWVFRGQIPFLKVGETVRFELAQVREWIKEQNTERARLSA